MVRRTKAEALETRARIIDAAERVFLHKGVLSASLNDIATEAGVTRGAIYWHFKNKHDVFMAMVERGRLPFDMLSDQAEDPQEPDPLGKLEAFMVFVLRKVVTDPCHQRLVEIMFHKCEFSGENAQLLVRQQEKSRESCRRIGRMLANAVNRGQLPEHLDVCRASVWLHSQLTGVIMHWLLDPDSLDLALEADNIAGTTLCCLQHSHYLLQTPPAA